ncbi:MAG: small subunit ribosomal protein [Nocardioidaceae bacterium]|nr:small subunit ribosomal protein [Nocardioidaceae bacterium]
MPEVPAPPSVTWGRRFRDRPGALIACAVRPLGATTDWSTGVADTAYHLSRSGTPDATALLPRNDRGRLSPKEVETALRTYEVMVILDPSLDERTVAPSLDTYLNVVRQDGGQVESVDVWGKRRLAYEIDKNAEGIYAVVDLRAEPATVKELDRQLSLNESVLRTKVIRPDIR